MTKDPLITETLTYLFKSDAVTHTVASLPLSSRLVAPRIPKVAQKAPEDPLHGLYSLFRYGKTRYLVFRLLGVISTN